MAIVYIALISAAALVSLVVAMTGMPGGFILFLVILVISIIEGFDPLGYGWILVFFFVAAAAEVFEYLSGLIGTRRLGGSRSAMKGALIGGMTGALLLSAVIPVWGFLVGVFPGTFIGAFIGEYNKGKDFYRSSKAGMGALAGRVVASSLKVFVILFMASMAVARYSGLF